MKTNESVIQIPLAKLKPFPNHPFQVRDDQAMQQLIESIRDLGILVPAIVRESGNGDYELIAGHRRKHACEILEIESLPAVVREADDDTATIMMVDSNFQRESILPSEKGKAYKMKLDAIKCQGARMDLITSDHSGRRYGVSSREMIAENSPDSSTQIHRFIRLTELIPELLDMVDDGKIGVTPAAEISYLSEEEQKILKITIDTEQASPSKAQALRLKKLSQAKLLTDDMILTIMTEQKKPDSWVLPLPMNRVLKYFPNSCSQERMQETIFQLLDRWLALQIKKKSEKEQLKCVK